MPHTVRGLRFRLLDYLSAGPSVRSVFKVNKLHLQFGTRTGFRDLRPWLGEKKDRIPRQAYSRTELDIVALRPCDRINRFGEN